MSESAVEVTADAFESVRDQPEIILVDTCLSEI